MSTEGYVYKGGKSHQILATGAGKVMRTCNREGCCRGKERFERYRLLPCNHHALLRLCTCRIRDRQCSACQQVFIAVREFWYRITDPHAKYERGYAMAQAFYKSSPGRKPTHA